MMMFVTLIMAAAHVTQIALWALALMLSGQVAEFDRAFYCSAQNYTTLSYGDVLLPAEWRLLGPLEAMTGLLFCGLSTAVLFAVMSRLVAKPLRAFVVHPSRPGRVWDGKGAENSFSGEPTDAG